ncbi:Zinc finger BED domain-containing protein 5 [Araneus ventricosus]|uniref:Zinc finger BED domain-containing protein 5 n=1 Tax=Araneus ventricosus TaxID=182803 RepID=A0A4Y2VMS1_ARAVE|nr:Zinc finger BED domain-containing protein 5 [Araneus ventricosus]
MDKSTGVAGLAILMVILLYPYLDSFHEDLLFSKPLPSTSTGTGIFKLLDEFFAENSVLWDNCVDVCTYGAKAMTGKMSGAVAKIKGKAKGCKSVHCILHQHALAMKKMPPFKKEVLSEIVKITNFIKSRPKNNRLFKILCDGMESLHTSLLLHPEIRWLFRGKAVTVFDATDKAEGFKKKLKYWVDYIKNGSLDCFPLTKGFGEELESDIPADILNQFVIHLLRLIDAFNSYFTKRLRENLKENVWVVEPYSISKKPSSLTPQEYECLLDLTSTSKFKTEKSISDFWCTLKDELKVLSDKANLILLPFSTTYSVETGFSAYTATKTKYRSLLNVEQDIHLQLSEIQPDTISLCKSKQPHPSY